MQQCVFSPTEMVSHLCRRVFLLTEPCGWHPLWARLGHREQWQGYHAPPPPLWGQGRGSWVPPVPLTGGPITSTVGPRGFMVRTSPTLVFMNSAIFQLRDQNLAGPSNILSSTITGNLQSTGGTSTACGLCLFLAFLPSCVVWWSLFCSASWVGN